MVCPCCLPPGACQCPGAIEKVVLIELGPASVSPSSELFCGEFATGPGFSRFEDVIESLSGTTLEMPLNDSLMANGGFYAVDELGVFGNLVLPMPGGTWLSLGVGLFCNTNLRAWVLDILDPTNTPAANAFARASIPTIAYPETPAPTPARNYCTYSGLVRSINASTSPAQNPFAGRRFGARLPPDSIGGTPGVGIGLFWDRTGNSFCSAVATFEYINIYLENALP